MLHQKQNLPFVFPVASKCLGLKLRKFLEQRLLFCQSIGVTMNARQ